VLKILRHRVQGYGLRVDSLLPRGHLSKKYPRRGMRASELHDLKWTREIRSRFNEAVLDPGHPMRDGRTRSHHTP
jgi:hypothetical protein